MCVLFSCAVFFNEFGLLLPKKERYERHLCLDCCVLVKSRVSCVLVRVSSDTVKGSQYIKYEKAKKER